MLKIYIPKDNSLFQLEVDEGTLVSEVLETIQDEIEVKKNIKYWTCYSFTQQKVLKHQEMFRAQQNEELYIYFDNKDNFSDIYEQRLSESKLVTQSSSLSTERHTSRQFTDRHSLTQSNISNEKIIVLDGVKSKYEIDADTTVKELLEFIAYQNEIEFNQLQKIENWICYSEALKRKMNLDEKIGNRQNEIFQITTHKLIHAQSSSNLHQLQRFNSQHNLLQNASYHEIPESLMSSKTITLTIITKDILTTRNLNAMFLIDQTIQNIAEYVLKQLNLNIEQVSVDIFIDQKQFNNPNKRVMTLQEANLHKGAQIKANIRWIN